MKKFQRSRFTRERKKAAGAHGLTILYVGNGKGKTTAAIGLAVRAAGSGMSVIVLQFMKSKKWQSYERQALETLGVRVRVLGSGFVGIIDDVHPLRWHKQNAKKALSIARRILRSKRFRVVVLDEVVTAVEEGLLTIKDVQSLIRDKPKEVHLALTGHSKYPSLIAACDLVTEMKNIKHPYYTEGLLAQRGIDF